MHSYCISNWKGFTKSVGLSRTVMAVMLMAVMALL